MIDTLATFTDQVTNVAREVGSEGSWADKPGFRAPPARGATSPTT